MKLEEDINAAEVPPPHARKVYVQGSRPDIQVPMREIHISPTPSDYGAEDNPPLRLYDRGELSKEEFERIRALLGERLRHDLQMPAAKPAAPPEPEKEPKSEPENGIRPAEGQGTAAPPSPEGTQPAQPPEPPGGNPPTA